MPTSRRLARGLRERTGEPVGVCPLDAIRDRSLSSPSRGVVAVGERAYAASVRTFGGAVLPVLVKALPAGAERGLSLYLPPELHLRQLRAVAPQVRTVRLIHRSDVPKEVLDKARAAARGAGVRLETRPVGDIREAARAVDQVLRPAGPGEAVWFHRGVLGMNPDIPVPPAVRLSWERKIPVLADEADYVERGLLLALAPDYAALGRAAGALLGGEPQRRVAYPSGAKRILNRRTARALGLAVGTSAESAFQYVYE